MAKRKTSKTGKMFKFLIVLLILGFAGLCAWYVISNKDNKSKGVKEFIKEKIEDVVQEKPKPKLKIVDEDSNTRTIAVMIPHDTYGGQTRQHGIQKAYVIYEILAEGSITRLEAFFRDVDVPKIGPIRSSRSYYLDYAMEHDAIYVHWGWSPQAKSDISTLKINNINGLYEENISIFRDKNFSSPNNGFTSTDNIYKRAEKKGYATTSDNWKVFNYSVDPVDYSSDETYKEAKKISVKYSSYYTGKYTYDEENKYYLRFNNSNKHIDNETGEQLHVKNILILKINYSLIAGDTKGRIDLKNIGTGDGYYITEGGCIDITWSKDSRKGKTKYYDKSGKEIQLNDGNTYIQVQPVNYSLTIE